MRKKILSALLLGLFTVASTSTFVSCKDYDDDVKNLQEQITTNDTNLKKLVEDKIALVNAEIEKTNKAISDAEKAYKAADEELQKQINAVNEAVQNGNFTILLSHRPELFEVYADNKMDLVLSGHAHGGQFRLPFVGGLVAPNQGLFPKYDAGLYTEENTNMIVSRGIGNSILPFRFNNRPEVILIELESEKS